MSAAGHGAIVDVELGEEVTAEVTLHPGPVDLDIAAGVHEPCEICDLTFGGVVHGLTIPFPCRTLHSGVVFVIVGDEVFCTGHVSHVGLVHVA